MRRKAIKAARSGAATITKIAVKFGVGRATLHRWLQAFDPDHPIASTRPRKRGPKGPRWGDETINAALDIIRVRPEWGKRRVGASLADRGIVVSEKTVGNILKVARQRLAREQECSAAGRTGTQQPPGRGDGSA